MGREKAEKIRDIASKSESILPRPPSAQIAPVQLKQGLPEGASLTDIPVVQLKGGAGDVQIHYDSPEPAAMGALAFTQGGEIFVGPGQEKHLPHEAWHVVQQAQGRVQPTLIVDGALVQQPVQKVAQLKAGDAAPKTGEIPLKASGSEMPDHLKAGIEALSGVSMESVKVHYNSSEPAKLKALAYAQGTEIFVAPGQEKHLPHEAWHVVQQAQGRVKPTLLRDGVAVNDDAGLETEADRMGGRAAAGGLVGPVGSGASLGIAESTHPAQLVAQLFKTKMDRASTDTKLDAYKSSILFKALLEDSKVMNWCFAKGYLKPDDIDQTVLAAIFAARKYTQADFQDINRVLWKLDATDEVAWSPADFFNTNKVKKAFNQAMQLIEAYPILLRLSGDTADCYRFEDSSKSDDWAARKVGDKYTFKGFMSTTLAAAKPSAISGNDAAVKVQIRGQQGVKLYEELTAHENEVEFLLKPGLTFTVEEVVVPGKEYKVRSS